MRQSHLFARSQKTVSSDIEAISHKLLIRGDYINQLGAGIYTLLPLGFRVYKKIEGIIRKAMNEIEAQELLMPILQPSEIWKKSGRLKTMNPPLFQTTDRHKKNLVLASTHEEVVTILSERRLNSYRDLPQAVYQIQTKFRNEMRATGGLLRVREFIMKDLYSFHESEDSLNEYYLKVKKAYLNIFKAVGLPVTPVEASTGDMGGAESHEFMCITDTGEDTVFICSSCGWGANIEVLSNSESQKTCPKCNKKLEKKKAIENGHIFKLGTKYSESLKTYFTTKDGKKKPSVMGCYGIGLGRLMATVVEFHNDGEGIIWPYSVAPFQAHIVTLGRDPEIIKKSKKYADAFSKSGIDTLLDDRDESAGVKLVESDLLGIPFRIVVSAKTTDKKIEVKERSEKNPKFISIENLIKLLKETYG